MLELHTFPDQYTLEMLAEKTPDYMHPNHIPAAVMVNNFLSKAECETIVERLDKFEGYNHIGCNALTRECGHVPELDGIRDFTRRINEVFWNYDLDDEPMTWMQTYSDGGDYQLHMDGAPARMRKLTAVVLLTEHAKFGGGVLELFLHPADYVVSGTQGTIAIFQPWVLHKVHKVVWGERKTINMGFHGPAFR